MTEQEYQEYQDRIFEGLDDKCDACDRERCHGYGECPDCGDFHNDCESCG